MLRLTEFSEVLPTHVLVPAGPIPTAADPEGVYPYESYCETSRRPVLRRYRFVALENEFLRVVVCPDLGGRVFSLRLKDPDREVLHVSRTIRPVRILPRHAFIGGGIEVSFPISHTPSLLEPVLWKTADTGRRIHVWCGERELRFGMHWTVGFSLGAEDTFLTQHSTFVNPGTAAHPWMSWSNAGVAARPDTQFHFPPGPVLRHDDQVAVVDWETEGPRRQADVKRMTGYFWKHPGHGAFGVFTPSLGCGLYHVADPARVPGIKLWTDGVGRDERWVDQYTLDRSQCLEIQAGPLPDQSVKAWLGPGERHEHTEYWFPTAEARDPATLALPDPATRDETETPLFSWARPAAMTVWQAALSACKNSAPATLPDPPPLEDNSWAPSGLPGLSDALQWAADHSPASEASLWLFHLGALLAGSDRIPEALTVLATSDDDRAHALRGCLLRRSGTDPGAAAAVFRLIRSEALALHPQVVIERDLALEALGAAGCTERRAWLDRVSALEDEWLIERRAALAADEGCWEEAARILASARFQLVHQRVGRTELWERIRPHLKEPPELPGDRLGEDDLAPFGAYREFEEPGTRTTAKSSDRQCEP